VKRYQNRREGKRGERLCSASEKLRDDAPEDEGLFDATTTMFALWWYFLLFSTLLSPNAAVILQKSTKIPPFYHPTGTIIARFEEEVANGNILRLPPDASLPVSKQPLVYQLPSRMGPHCSQEMQVLLVFGEHARELISSELALHLLELFILPSNTTDDMIHYLNALRRCTTITLVPILCSAERKLVERGQFCQRKTLSGVDLNRNWEFQWGNRKDMLAEENPGPRPFSEIESQLIRNLARRIKPSVYMNIHSGEKSIYSPWDHRKDIDPALQPMHDIVEGVWETLREVYAISDDAQRKKWHIGASGASSSYRAYGTSVDWMVAMGGVPFAFTLEVYGTENEKDPCLAFFNPLTERTYHETMATFALVVLEIISETGGARTWLWPTAIHPPLTAPTFHSPSTATSTATAHDSSTTRLSLLLFPSSNNPSDWMGRHLLRAWSEGTTDARWRASVVVLEPLPLSVQQLSWNRGLSHLQQGLDRSEQHLLAVEQQCWEDKNEHLQSLLSWQLQWEVIPPSRPATCLWSVHLSAYSHSHTSLSSLSSLSSTASASTRKATAMASILRQACMATSFYPSASSFIAVNGTCQLRVQSAHCSLQWSKSRHIQWHKVENVSMSWLDEMLQQVLGRLEGSGEERVLSREAMQRALQQLQHSSTACLSSTDYQHQLLPMRSGTTQSQLSRRERSTLWHMWWEQVDSGAFMVMGLSLCILVAGPVTMVAILLRKLRRSTKKNGRNSAG